MEKQSSSSSSSKRGTLLAKFKNAVSRDSGSDSAENSTESTTGAVSERRREQIRRAQRLHRIRKAEHSQRLTAEIADLRAKDASKTARIDYLESTVAFLSNLLNQHGIRHDIPKPSVTQQQALVVVHETTSSSLSSSSRGPSNQPMQWIQVRMPGRNSSSSNNDNDNNSHDPSSNRYAHHLSSDMVTKEETKLCPSNMTTVFPASDHADLSDAQTGIDFILTLEHLCLYHHHGPPPNDAELLYHSGMMQAPIMARAPPLLVEETPTTPGKLPPHVSWTVPSEELERLLSFSNQLRLPGEITPVQAWSQIRERAESSGWSPSRACLQGLLNELKPAVVCYGFGAVLGKTTFVTLLNRHCRSAPRRLESID